MSQDCVSSKLTIRPGGVNELVRRLLLSLFNQPEKASLPLSVGRKREANRGRSAGRLRRRRRNMRIVSIGRIGILVPRRNGDEPAVERNGRTCRLDKRRRFAWTGIRHRPARAAVIDKP